MDLVYRLLGHGDQFFQTMRTGTAEAKRADSQLEKFTSTMDRQRSSAEMSARQQEILALADKGASAAKVEYALALASELDSLEALQAAEVREAAAKERAASVVTGLITSLERENQTLTLTAAELLEFQLRSSGASTAQVTFALDVQRANAAIQDEQLSLSNLAAAEAEAARYAQDLIERLRFQIDTAGMSAEAIERLTLRKRGLSNAEIETVIALQRETTALKDNSERQADAARYAKELTDRLSFQALQFGMSEDAAQRLELRIKGLSAAEIQQIQTLRQEITALQAAKEAQESKNQAVTKGTAGVGGLSRNSMLLTESMRGMEDAVAGFTNNGLKGMLMATTNNTNQIGSLLGGTAGLALSVGSIAGLIGVSLIPMLMKWGDQTEELRKKEQALADDQKRHHDDYMAQISQRIAANSQNQGNKNERANLVGDRDASSSALAAQLKRDKDELAKNQADQRTIREQQFARDGRMMSLREQITTEQLAPKPDKAAIEAKQKEMQELEAAERAGQARMKALRIDEGNIRRNIEETNAARVHAVKREQDKKALEEADREKNELIKMRADRAKQEKELADKAATERDKAEKEANTEEKRQKELLEKVRKNDDSNLGVVDKRAANEKAARDRFDADMAAINQARSEVLINDAEADALRKRAAEARDKRLAEAGGENKEKPDKAPKDLTATSTRSAEGVSDVFKALGIGQPTKTMEDLAKKGNVIAQTQVERTEELLNAVKELIPVTTGQVA